MSSNIEIEREIQHRARDYPAAAANDIAWFLSETARLRDAAADEYKQHITADESAARALLGKTDARVKVRELAEIIAAQSVEIAELTARVRAQGEEIATLRGFPGKVIVR